MTPINNSRITWVDSMKAFSIMAVVLYHTPIVPEIKTLSYLVCLPAFFFVSGLFTNTKISPKEFFLKKTLRLLIPYIIWGLSTWFFWFFGSSRYGSSVENNIEWWNPLLGLLCGKGEMLSQNTPLWFLCCMISLEWIYFFIRRIPKQWLRWIIIACLSIIGCIASHKGQNWVWEISAALIILPIYSIGAEYHRFFKENLNTLNSFILISILVMSSLGIWIGYLYNNDIKLYVSVIGNPILYYLTAISAIGLLFSTSLLIEKVHSHLMPLIQCIGQNTLLILCAHIPTFSIIKGIAFICAIPLTFFDSTIGCLVLWICTFFILVPLSSLVNRYCPILLGKINIPL